LTRLLNSGIMDLKGVIMKKVVDGSIEFIKKNIKIKGSRIKINPKTKDSFLLSLACKVVEQAIEDKLLSRKSFLKILRGK